VLCVAWLALSVLLGRSFRALVPEATEVMR